MGFPQRRNLPTVGPAAVSADITGTLAVTLGAVTVAASGEVKTDGTLSRTLGDVTIAASGELKIQGSLSQTLSDTTLAGAGLVKHIHGGLSATLGNASLAAAGEVEAEGSLSQTLANATLAASGEIKAEGSLARTLADATLSAAGEVKVQGSLAQTLAPAALAASGIVGDVVVGTLDVVLAGVTLNASGEVESPPVVEEAPVYHGGGGRRRRLRDGLEPGEVEAQYELLELRRKAQRERLARGEDEVPAELPPAVAPLETGIEARVVSDLPLPAPLDPTALIDGRVRAFTDEQARISAKSRTQVAGVLAEAKRRADEEFMLMAVAIAVALEDED